MTAAVAGLALAAQASAAATDSQLAALVILLVMASVAAIWPIHLSTKVKITVDDMPLFAAALVLSPLDAMLIAGASTLIGLRFRNTRMRWYTRGFNAAASTLGVGAAAMTYAALQGPTPPAMSGAVAIVGAGLAKYLVQAVLVDLVVALQLKRRPFDSWLEMHRRDIPYETALYLLGALAAISVGNEPIALVLFAVPMAALLLALRE